MSTKSKLLATLEKNKGKYVSGQELAHILNVSRTAIWKAIKDLQSEGYPIGAGNNKGYTLAESSNILSVEAMEPFLNEEINAKLIHIYKEVDSTNNQAKRLIIDDVPNNTVIIAEKQTSGRGRRGKGFASPPGDSVYISFILKSMLDVEDSLLLTVAASVAVTRAVEQVELYSEHDLSPQIKWVNDVYLGEKKICGILTEAVSDLESGQIHSLILGIGVNINADLEKYPSELRNIIGTLDIPSGNRNRFVASLINEVFKIQNEIHGYIENRSEEPLFMKEYRKKSMILGKDINVIKNDSPVQATALDINNHGALLVKYKTGETELLSTGEISIRLNNKSGI